MFTGEEEAGEEAGAIPAEGADEGTEEQAPEGEDNSEKSSDDAEGEAPKDGEDATKEEEDEEPPTRKPKTNADWVALRRQKKLEKVQKEKEQGEDKEGEDDAEDDDLDMSDEDAKLIDKVVSKRLAPIEQERQETQLKGEINDFIATNPEFAPFKDKALKWAKHPSWKDIPTKQLMFAVAGEKLLKIGATREKQAGDKARATKTGTNTGGDATGKKPVWEMSDAEFAKEVEAVKLGTK